MLLPYFRLSFPHNLFAVRVESKQLQPNYNCKSDAVWRKSQLVLILRLFTVLTDVAPTGSAIFPQANLNVKMQQVSVGI